MAITKRAKAKSLMIVRQDETINEVSVKLSTCISMRKAVKHESDAREYGDDVVALLPFPMLEALYKKAKRFDAKQGRISKKPKPKPRNRECYTYPDDVWSSDKAFPREDWQAEVADGDTNRGYWEWVAAKRQEAKYDAATAAGDDRDD